MKEGAMNTEPQYWVVGANWEGNDQAEDFFRRGYWELGWGDSDQPGMAQQRDNIKVGDRVSVKSMRGRGASTITIRGLGIVKDIGPDKRIYIDWRVTGMDREVPAKGCFASIHGPYSVAADSVWLGQVFRL